MKFKAYYFPAIIGATFVLLFSSLFYINFDPLQNILNEMTGWTYDAMVRGIYKPLSKDCPIVIVDIDDKSIVNVGRWPWPRKHLANLVNKCFEKKAKVIAFDMIFPDHDKNIVSEVIRNLPEENNEFVKGLETIQESFDFDKLFAKSLEELPSILGYVLTSGPSFSGMLPPPWFKLDPRFVQILNIPSMKGYLGNIDVLQKAAKNGGFVNATPDTDGVLRETQLILFYNSAVYPSLSLQAAKIFLNDDKLALLTKRYGDLPVLEGIRMNNQDIHTGPWGQIFIPFRGPPFSFKFISAIDLLRDEVAKEELENKLIFIGSTATAIGDFKSTSMSPVFPGVEIQASIASGIIDNYIPHKPAWGKGLTVLQILILGLICALIFPAVGPFVMVMITSSICVTIIASTWWFWIKDYLVFYFFFPVLVTLILFIFNLIYGFFVQMLQRKEIKSIFGQYVSPEYVDIMLEKDEKLNLEGESKELTVLFADIFDFTKMSEQMSAPKLKKILNLYFTPMTEAIFSHKGTIDKYAGDMVMAFWGAPLEDTHHSFDGVTAAMDMQKKLAEINRQFRSEGLPEIRLGIGINTGQMNVGDMGSKFRRAYTVLGDAVNLASRLEKATRAFQTDIIVGENTWNQTKDLIVYRSLGKIKVKGKAEITNIFAPICLKEENSSQVEEEIKLYNEAFASYLQKNWPEAIAKFQHLLQIYPQHKPLYEAFIHWSSDYQKNPPPPDWDGTFSVASD